MISTTSQYALRALAHLAESPPGTAMLGRELAKQAEIPANYLSKVLLALRNAGFLSTARGSGGGYSLQKRPEDIHLIDVVVVFDAQRAEPSCLLRRRECSDDSPCSAHAAWREVRSAYIQFLERTTLADISFPRSGDTTEGDGPSLTLLSGGQQT